MILPQLEEQAHGPEVVGMFFFEDNNYVLVNGDPLGERLAKVAAEQKRSTFLYVGAPLRVQGGTGSPLNPLAVF